MWQSANPTPTVSDRLDFWKRRDSVLTPDRILPLDFANTLDWGRNPFRVHDDLDNYQGLLAWSKSRNLLNPGSFKNLIDWAEKNPTGAKRVYGRAVDLRMTTYRIFSAIPQNRIPTKEDVDKLNRMMRNFLLDLHLVSRQDKFEWDWYDNETRPDSMLWPVAKSAVDLLTTGNLDRIGECANIMEGCSWLFYDETKNRTRRWCHMAFCGNRMKYWKRKQGNP